MASWGWRSLVMLVFICVIVLVVAVSDIIPHRAPILPTDLPPLTLVLRTITESPPIDLGLPVILTLVDDFPPIPTLPPHAPTSDLILDITPPTCYEMPHDGIQCLGFIHNPHAESLENVRLRMMLWNQDAGLVDHISFTLAQKTIPPYSHAPYQVIFSRDSLRSADFGGTKVEFVHGTLAPYLPTLIHFEETSAEWYGNIYRLSGTLQHDLGQDISVRLVVSLLDEAGHLMGFRVIEADFIQSGIKHPLNIDMMPMIADERLTHSIYIEMITAMD